MGANHVSVVYATWGRILHGTAFRLLVHMALTAKDADNPPMYWAGRDGMADALGKDDDPAGHQAVKRALSVLKREGAVKLNRAPRKGKYATRWEIVLHPPLGDEKRTPMKPDTGDGSGTETVPQSGTESDPIGVRKTTDRGTETDPQRTTRTTKSEMEEEISSTEVSTDRACEPNATTDEMTPFEASKILSDAGRAGINVVALVDSAPPGLTTKTQRRVWAARQVLAKDSA